MTGAAASAEKPRLVLGFACIRRSLMRDESIVMIASAGVAAARPSPARREYVGRSTVLSLCGECDLATRGQLQVELTRALSGRAEDLLILDLSRLGFCDLGCARLICAASHAGHVVVTGMSASMSKMFDMLDPGLTLSRSGAVHVNPHQRGAQSRGLSTSTTSTAPAQYTDGARLESTDEVRLPHP